MGGELGDWNYKSQSDSVSVFHKSGLFQKSGIVGGATAESEGTAVANRESYEGGGSKEKEGVGGSVLKLGCR